MKRKQLEDEMIAHSPTLLSILKSCTKVPRSNLGQQGLIGFITAILTKNRRSSASLVQRLISVILYGGHASKKVRECTYITCIIITSLNNIILYIVHVLTMECTYM